MDSRRDRVGPSDEGGYHGGGRAPNGAPPAGGRDDGTDPGESGREAPAAPRKRRASTLQDRRLDGEALFSPPGQGDNQTRILDNRGAAPERAGARGAPKGELIVRAGPVAGLRFALHAGVVVVGRSSQSDCAIPDEAVSRRHFELKVSPAGVQLRDLGSGNGTLVNDEKVDEAWLQSGDRIVVGDSTLEFRDAGPGRAAARKAAPVPARFAEDDDLGDEPKTWFLSRLPAGPRRLLVVVFAALGMIILLGVWGRVQKTRAQEALAVRLFQHGRDQLAANPPDPDAALDDFEKAYRTYPDKALVKEWADKAQAVSDALGLLSSARELVDKKDLDGARKKVVGLQTKGLPNSDFFDKAAKTILDDVDKRQAAVKADQEAIAHNAVDPTTLSEATANAQKAKKLESSKPEAAAALYELAYTALDRRHASGPEFDQLKADYVGFLLREARRQKRRNVAKGSALLERARAISPELVAAEEAPAPAPVIKPIHRPAPPPKRSHKSATRHAHLAPAAVPFDDSAPSSSPAATHKNAGNHVDEDHAEQLCDEGDALIGQDPAAARKSYNEALKFAKPGGEAAKRAQEGLSN